MPTSVPENPGKEKASGSITPGGSIFCTDQDRSVEECAVFAADRKFFLVGSFHAADHLRCDAK
jgi:hypothetical protein